MISQAEVPERSLCLRKMSVIGSEGKCCCSTWVSSWMPKMNKKTKEMRERYDWIKHSQEDFLTINERFRLLDRENMYSQSDYTLFSLKYRTSTCFFRFFSLKIFVERVCRNPVTAIKGTTIKMDKVEWDLISFPTKSSGILSTLQHIVMASVDSLLFWGQHAHKQIVHSWVELLMCSGNDE